MINYPLSDDTWGQEEIDAINRVIESKRFTMGEKTKEFEKYFASFFGSKYAVMVNSGSSANLIAIAALIYSGKLKKGDEVIVPAISWSTTYFPLYQYGLKLKFIDINIKTLNMETQQLESAIGPRTRAIFAVNLLGNPNDYTKILSLCDKYDLILIEDNCEAMGAKYGNKYAGTFGKISTFSMFYSHHICTMEGGVAVTDDEELWQFMLPLRAHGWTRDLPKSSTIYQKSENEFYESYNFILPGYNLRPLEIEAATGIEQLRKLDKILSVRRENARCFRNLFANNADIEIQEEIGLSSWFGFSLILKNRLKNKRDLVVEKLAQNGIETRPIVAGNFVRNECIKFFNYELNGPLINADYVHENGFFIGNHSSNIEGKIEYLYDIMNNT